MHTPPREASITLDFSFEAAHYLPKVSEGHKCRRLHGHSYRVALTLVGPIDPEFGWVMDFDEIEVAAAPIVGSLDHRTLNDIAGLENPTSELIAVYLYEKLAHLLPALKTVTVFETANARASVSHV